MQNFPDSARKKPDCQLTVLCYSARMKILSIETSCDETAVSIVEIKGDLKEVKVLSNIVSSQIELHAQYGGVFPMMAKREHAKNIIPIFEKTLKKSKLYSPLPKNKLSTSLKKTRENKIKKLLERESELCEQFIPLISKTKKPKIDLIAVTTGPGLEPALWVGVNFARALSVAWEGEKIPIVSVNHMLGHTVSSIAEKVQKNGNVKIRKISFPAIALLVSGGHTEILKLKDFHNIKKLGKTRDDAVGEAFDKVARLLGLPYPGGPQISRLAEEARSCDLKNENYKLPRPMIHSKDYDFSYSGLKTAVLYMLQKITKITEDDKKMVAREFEEAAIEVLVHKTLRAIEEEKVKTILVGGGVARNKHLEKVLRNEVKKKFLEVEILFPEPDLSTDNSLMIALAGFMKYKKSNKKSASKIKAEGNLSL